METKIPDGCILLARKLFESDVWLKKPSAWGKIWIYILGRVNHSAKAGFNRGEGFFNFAEESRAIGYDVKYNSIMKFLIYAENSKMISKTKSTRGILIKVLNYAAYQDIVSYRRAPERNRNENEENAKSEETGSKTESGENKTEKGITGETSGGTDGKSAARQRQDRSETINNNDNNGRMEELKTKDIYPKSEKPKPSFDLNTAFIQCWAMYPRRLGRKAAEKHFRASVKTLDDLSDIKKSIQNYSRQIQENGTEMRYVKMGSTFFNNWQDYVELYANEKPKLTPAQQSAVDRATTKFETARDDEAKATAEFLKLTPEEQSRRRAEGKAKLEEAFAKALAFKSPNKESKCTI